MLLRHTYCACRKNSYQKSHLRLAQEACRKKGFLRPEIFPKNSDFPLNFLFPHFSTFPKFSLFPQFSLLRKPYPVRRASNIF
ncbi:hypothetical protein RchiOBHm_Chr1g0357571 [Rosa chinensis]|uniref:Uncharacterized protein n=1 Tax=Rosa chinensis TaxID=74649 RepID=A0A2P6SHX7_ROSCH|nr:hypothetical protein RchiOBHm_Chr1g0357571 [Rosa chinensis]